MIFEDIGLLVPRILFPRTGTDLTKWAVVACDQYTSQPEYWERVKEFVGLSPSTFHIILPEAYLEECDNEKAARKIDSTMEEYLDKGVLVPLQPGFILVDRTTARGTSLKGLMAALDLERYDFRKGSKSLIRATEGTVIDRLPPRIKIRQGAPIESPHIMVLIDDPGRTVIEPLFGKNPSMVYDFDLMENSGHIKGYMIDDPGVIGEVAQALTALADPDTFQEKYRVEDRDVLLYAVGDGNHSLATAKEIWENLKRKASDKAAVMNHPARYALVELVNLHDEGLTFEPIDRVVWGCSLEDMLGAMERYYTAQGSEFAVERSSRDALVAVPSKLPDTHRISFVTADSSGTVSIRKPKHTLEVGTLQNFLDEYMNGKAGMKIDYIHGEEIVKSLASRPDTIGFFLPVISKPDFFRTIVADGVLPRKTFSMGHADEKRFYLECRKIVE
ncbi:MAG TPA: DUF1015 domain-containing protein [Deltaproteobacteria bacterium]|jgi:hypothetical protein|nr:DUF1015 domain-containing protein [Deltaproteobacteria bacterium]